MRLRLLSLLLLVPLFPLASSAGDKKANPYSKAKVGDYVSYRMTTSVMGKEFKIDLKQTVTEKSDTEVTVKTTTMLGGKDLPGQTNKIDLTKPFDPAAIATQNGKKGKFEKKAEGKEKVKIGDKTYDCTWISGKMTADFKGNTVESDVKVWTSKSVPLGGMVKLELKSDFADVRMEVSGSGSEK
jgi:hypothetical protein